MQERFLDGHVFEKASCHAIGVRLRKLRCSLLQNASDGSLGDAVFCHAEDGCSADLERCGILRIAFCPSKIVPIGIFFVFQSPMMFWLVVIHGKKLFAALFDRWEWEEMSLRVIFPRMVTVNDVIVVAGFGIPIEHRPCCL